MHTEQLTTGDLLSIQELQPPDWADMLPHLNFYINSPYCFPIKFIIDSKIVSIGTTIIHNDVAWLAHVIVHPGYRNKGIGQTTTQALVDSLKTTNCKTIYLIATELGEPVYKRIGFEIETDYLFFKGEDAAMNFTKSESITDFEEKYRPQVITIDKEVSGENRIMHVEQHLPSAFVFTKGDNVEGYYLPDFNDGLIVAINATAGIGLIKLRLMQKNYAVLPADNAIAIKFLLDNNFKEYKRAKRMRLGKKRPWKATCIYNRVSGQIG